MRIWKIITQDSRYSVVYIVSTPQEGSKSVLKGGLEENQTSLAKVDKKRDKNQFQLSYKFYLQEASN